MRVTKILRKLWKIILNQLRYLGQTASELGQRNDPFHYLGVYWNPEFPSSCSSYQQEKEGIRRQDRMLYFRCVCGPSLVDQPSKLMMS